MGALALLLSVLLADRPEHIAKGITVKPVAFDSVTEALHIISRSGTVDLTAPRSKARLEIEAYHNGQKLDDSFEGVALGTVPQDATTQIQFVVHIIDMDYMAFANGKADHSRLMFKIGIGPNFASTSHDFSKKQCDFSQMTSGGSFRPKTSTKDRVPVYWMVGGTNAVGGGATPEQVVQQNPKGDVAIIYVTATN